MSLIETRSLRLRLVPAAQCPEKYTRKTATEEAPNRRCVTSATRQHRGEPQRGPRHLDAAAPPQTQARVAYSWPQLQRPHEDHSERASSCSVLQELEGGTLCYAWQQTFKL